MALTTNEEALVRQLIEQNAELLNLATNEATIISKLAATKKNLGQLTSASSVSGTDISFVRQGTADKSATLDMLRGYMTPNQATETTTGVVELATTAEAVALIDNSRVITPATLGGLFARSLTSNGYCNIPGGLIIQWGATGILGTDATVTVTFPIAFPTACLCAVAQSNLMPGGTEGAAISTRGYTKTTMLVGNDTSSSTATWIAIGF